MKDKTSTELLYKQAKEQYESFGVYVEALLFEGFYMGQMHAQERKLAYEKLAEKEKAGTAMRVEISNDDIMAEAKEAEEDKEKVVDLSALVGNTEILFEFSHDGKYWLEGYLSAIGPKYLRPCWARGRKKHFGIVCSSVFFKHIRFQTDRWYPRLKSPISVPDGVKIKVHARRGIIIAYKIVGLKDGWKYNR